MRHRAPFIIYREQAYSHLIYKYIQKWLYVHIISRDLILEAASNGEGYMPQNVLEELKQWNFNLTEEDDKQLSG